MVNSTLDTPQTPNDSEIHITKADVDRAVRNARKFREMVERGKTAEDIFEDLLKLVHVGSETTR